MDYLLITLLIAACLLLTLLIVLRKKKPVPNLSIPDAYKLILEDHVPFYKNLDEEKKKLFEQRMMRFLARTRITGVKTEVEEKDRVFIAASAIIPIFGFPGWEYNNLKEVLLYPDTFNHDFEQTGEERNILGLVGEGAYNNVMILSRSALRNAYENETSKTNTALHEFVHLLDKTDGSMDGLPEFFLNREYVVPWLQLMHKEIEEIRKDKSDINPYGATNQAEFLAVASEYFFERPDLLKTKHPELYALLSKLYDQKI